MITVTTIRFKYNGKKFVKRGFFQSVNIDGYTDIFGRFSADKRNQCFDTEDFYEDGFWTMIFHGNEKDPFDSIEVRFKYYQDNKSTIPISIVVWKDDIIIDVIDKDCVSVVNS